MSRYIKLKPGETTTVKLKVKNPTTSTNNWGSEVFQYTFIKDDIDCTLEVSPTSAVVKDLEIFSIGDEVTITKQQMKNGRSTYRAFPPGDIMLQSAAQEAAQNIENARAKDAAAEKIPQLGEDRQEIIMKQLTLKCASNFLANRKTAKKEDVINLSEYFLAYLHGTADTFDKSDLPF